MAKPLTKKESYGLTVRKDAKYYCKHASTTWRKEGKRIMTRARRHDIDDITEDEDIAWMHYQSGVQNMSQIKRTYFSWS